MYRFRDSSLVKQVLAQTPHHLKLLFNSQPIDGGLNDVPHAGLVNSNEAVIIHVGEKSHDELAIHAIRNTTMAGNRLAKILDLESPLESRGKESTKRCDQRGERCENQDMQLDGLDIECGIAAGKVRDVIWLRNKGGVGRAFQSGQHVGSEVVDRADEVLVPHQDIGHEVSKANGANPGAQEPFNCLLRGNLDQLCATKCNTADVGKDIVRNHQGCGQEEPDHALQNVVHDEVCLNDDEVERHMGPGKLGELETVVAFLQGYDEVDET